MIRGVIFMQIGPVIWEE